VGVPAVLVPYPHATGDHQWLNAQHFVRAGGAVAVRDPSEAQSLVRELLADPERLEAMRAAMLAAARPDAAERIAEELIELAAARR
jgi:UDP-N-acetylglucosamine--N-acetylmuramyl-(pentapeptide) pyrophosphoryl-undecaprenol N-acetylglucosamine transferase